MKKLFIFMCLAILLVGTVSALDFDNFKYDKEIIKGDNYTVGDKVLTYTDLWKEYEPIEIENAFGLGDLLFRGAITKHTSQCSESCSSELTVEITEDSKLVEDIYFYTIKENGDRIEEDINAYNLEYVTSYKTEEVNIYGYNCDVTKLEDGHQFFDCPKVIKESYTKKVPVYQKFNIGDEFTAGTYEIKINGLKDYDKTVDWVIKTTGETLNAWAKWNVIDSVWNFTFDDSGDLGANTGINNSVNATNPSNWASVSSSDSCISGNCLSSINGTANFIPTTTTVHTGGWSIWANTTSWIGADGEAPSFVSAWCTPAWAEGCFNARLDAAGNRTYLAIGAGAGDVNQLYGNTKINLHEWYHYYYKINATGAYVYINGVMDSNLTGKTFGFYKNTSYQDGFAGGYGSEMVGELDEMKFFSTELSDNQILNLYETEAENPPIITLLSPSDNEILVSSSINFTAEGNNLTFQNMEWKNITYDIWYSNGTLFSSNFVDITDVDKFNETLEIDNFKVNNYKWNIYGCFGNTTFDNCTVSSNNETFIASSIIPAINYNSITYETSKENYHVNITSFGNNIPTNVKLDWNGTNYTGTATSLGSGNFSISASQSIPIVPSEANVTIRMSWENDGIIEQTTTFNQTIRPIDFSFCDSGTPYLNLSFKDENNLSILNGAISTSNFEYWLGDRSVTKNLTFINVTENPSYAFCFNITGKDLNVDSRIQYLATGYPQRVADPQAIVLSSNTLNTTLYLLSSADGLFVTFQVVNQAEQTLEGVDITINRTIGTEEVVIGFGTTTVTGTSQFWLNPDFTHRYVFEKEGLTTLTDSFPPNEAAFTIVMEGTGGTIQNDYSKGISYIINPVLFELTNGTTYEFNMSLNSSFWAVSEFGFTLSNSTSQLGSATASSNGGFVTTNLNVLDSSRITMNYFWVVNSTYINNTVSWNVFNTENTQWSIRNFFDDLDAYLDVGFFGIDDFGKNVIIFMILFISVGVLSYKFGATSAMSVTALIFAIIFFFDVVLGLLPSPVNAIPHTLTFLALLALIMATLKEVQF